MRDVWRLTFREKKVDEFIDLFRFRFPWVVISSTISSWPGPRMVRRSFLVATVC